MLYIYDDTPTQWEERRDETMLNLILAVVGTAAEFKEIGLRNLAPNKFHWTVSLKGGKQHPLWGKNQGSSSSMEEAKDLALEILRQS